jgi:hypothetical protein
MVGASEMVCTLQAFLQQERQRYGFLNPHGFFTDTAYADAQQSVAF